jgi:hypothetical protein
MSESSFTESKAPTAAGQERRPSRCFNSAISVQVTVTVTVTWFAGATSGNWVVEQSLANVKDRVHEGAPISQPLFEDPPPEDTEVHDPFGCSTQALREPALPSMSGARPR